jgi:SAM-dependent methyltransferase
VSRASPAGQIELGPRLEALVALLREFDDVVTGRVSDPAEPDWSAKRGWGAWLLSLDDDALLGAETQGLTTFLERDEGAEAPAGLISLADRVRAATALPSPSAPPARALRQAAARKARQVASLVALCEARLSRPRRLVDVGAGKGHLTRELARALQAPALGLERNPARVAAANALTDGDGAEFRVQELDVDSLAFAPGDLAVGLHACGALGDALVRAAARDRVDVLLVNCCLQHVPGRERTPLSARGQTLDLALGRDLLGLTNLVAGRRLVQGRSYALVMEERTARYGLRLLLAARGLDLGPGAEMRGVNLRKAKHGLAVLAAKAFAKRGLEAPSEAELAAAEAQAGLDYARMRRYSLPRAMFGRVLELAVVLDRALLLEEAGHDARVEGVFDLDDSPRNLGIVARAG